MVIAGFDPGQKGGVCVIDDGTPCAYFMPMPVKQVGKKKFIDEDALVVWLSQFKIDHAYIERVHFISGQGGVSAFTFGESLGVLKGITAALGAERHMIDPQKWKADMRVPADKAGAVARAERLFPIAKEQGTFVGPRGGLLDGIAEAGLIAMYGSLLQGVKFAAPIAIVSQA